MKKLAIIPARYHSSRLKGKPLADILGKTMIHRVYEAVVEMDLFQKVIVATDDQRIIDEVNGFNGLSMMTSERHRSGTDRCAEVIRNLSAKGEEFDLIVNIQGDEPGITKEALHALIEVIDDEQVTIASLVAPIKDKDLLLNPSVVKVVLDLQFNAIYFSRFPIPYQVNLEMEHPHYFQHIGVYAFRPETLTTVSELETTPLEKAESLEQLRWMENGYAIRMGVVSDHFFSIDTQEDLDNFIKNFQSAKGND